MGGLLWLIIAVLVVAWVLGFFVFHIASALIHIIIVIAIILVIVRLVSGRKAV